MTIVLKIVLPSFESSNINIPSKIQEVLIMIHERLIW